MQREEIEVIASGGGEPARELVVGLLEQVAEPPAMRERIEELERQAGRDTGTSSMPSSDAPKSRAERRRVAREAYKRSMRKSGGQPGHEGKTRELAAPERADERLVASARSLWLRARLTGAEEQIGDPVAHQQSNLAVVRALAGRKIRPTQRRRANTMRWRIAGPPPSVSHGALDRLVAHVNRHTP